MSTLSELRAQSNQLGIDFLRTEIALSNTFMDVAKTSRILANQQQGKLDAEKAYRSARHLRLKLDFTYEEAVDIACCS